MTASGYALFGTAIGTCGIAWSERGIMAVILPERDDAATRAVLERECPEAGDLAPPPAVQQAIDGITALLLGQPIDFATVPLDMDGIPPFHQRVYEVTRTIQPGSTLTYGEIANRLGLPGAARAVGHALGRNPIPIIVPCHRVLAAGAKLGGFSAPGGAVTKRRLLAIEGAQPLGQPTLFDLDEFLGAAPSGARVIKQRVVS